MKAMILAAATLSFASIAAAEQPPNSDVEARLAALEKINVTAYKPQQVSATDEAKDPQVEAILQKAADAEDDAAAQPQSQQQ
jgi:hypothetical protein